MVAISGEMKEEPFSLIQMLFVWFLRLMATVALFSGLSYWAQLTGLGAADLPRFDELPVHWQVPWVVLAVLLPCAAMGLWMLTSWGIVLWVIASFIEIGVYGVWSESYISRPAVVVGHAAALTLLALILVTMAIQRYRERLH
ncbi:DUF6163 family protein [Oricola sp.]|uniref:DUF6163 family protein n=1 Tax=Oricola sp. TaxID=1979950 RepID=UPI0025E96349|nr:DUF6163 family protein [Oricola sp.]MCI5077112.1 DUF6163 family protein [Oricola sp.]